MATTLEAVPTQYDVRLRALSDLPNGTAVEVTRTVRAGEATASASRVRGPLTFEDGAWVVVDLEVLFNTPVSYNLIAKNGAGTIVANVNAGPVMVTNPNPVLRSVLARGTKSTVRIVGQESGDYKNEVRRELLRPLGRKAPVVITDVRSAAAGEMTYLTLSAAEAKTMRAILDTGDVLIITGPEEFDLNWPLYMSVGDVAVKRVGESLSEARLWSCSWVEVDPPPVTLYEAVAATTWSDLEVAGKKWVDIRRTAWVDVLYPLESMTLMRAA